MQSIIQFVLFDFIRSIVFSLVPQFALHWPRGTECLSEKYNKSEKRAAVIATGVSDFAAVPVPSSSAASPVPITIVNAPATNGPIRQKKHRKLTMEREILQRVKNGSYVEFEGVYGGSRKTAKTIRVRNLSVVGCL